ncbi:MAG: ATP-binding protein [Succinivibrionaceae bacterium]|nr:ATP-binding protein [Succinivibrionaceae bacterium]
MLIEFRVQNFLSFNELQTFTMVKSKSSELPVNAFSIMTEKEFSLLKSAAVYGPNSCGKSNFLKALSAMKGIVTTTLQHGMKLPLTPFRLNPETVDQPTEFEMSFIVRNVKYQYGFSASADQIFDEWLFAFPAGRPQKWFERVWDAESGKHIWKFSHFLQGAKKLWLQSTRENALFLSTAVQLNSEQLKPVFDWFSKTLRFVATEGLSSDSTARFCIGDGKERVLKFLKAADFNIEDIHVKENNLPSEPAYEINTVHTDSAGRSVLFNFRNESSGTQKFFSFAEPILNILSNGDVLCIDELNVNLHPKLVHFLVELFHDPKANPKNAQLIFTTHDTTILTQKIFRRDQIWFCDKNKEQASFLYPLSDFSPKKGKENLEQGYLSGRYGALPLVRSFCGIE